MTTSVVPITTSVPAPVRRRILRLPTPGDHQQPAIASELDWVAFWQHYLPQLGLRWDGYRRLRRRISRRLRKRLAEVGLSDLTTYGRLLESDADECRLLESRLRMSISRFFRDRGVFEQLRFGVLPYLALLGEQKIRCWSVGCASGEEPYSLSILWNLELRPQDPHTQLEIIATEVEPGLVQRAREARYCASSVKEVPDQWIGAAFDWDGEEAVLVPEMRDPVSFLAQDVREESPSGSFDLVLCRNLGYTYFCHETQARLTRQLVQSLETGGFLVVGAHELVPEPWSYGLRQVAPCIYQKSPDLVAVPYVARNPMRSWLRP